MTTKESEDFALLFMTFLYEAKQAGDPAETANLSISMVKEILSKYPQIRYIIWEYNQQEYLDDFGLDYGRPKGF